MSSKKYLIDEDLPRSLVVALVNAGYQAMDVRDVGLRGAKDNEVFEYACAHEATVITADVGFGSMVYAMRTEHFGIIVLRLPSEWPVRNVIQRALAALARLDPEDIRGSIVVVDQQKIRVRREISPLRP
jgi:predicted nuclease of predicted toxin-antitoxin system